MHAFVSVHVRAWVCECVRACVCVFDYYVCVHTYIIIEEHIFNFMHRCMSLMLFLQILITAILFLDNSPKMYMSFSNFLYYSPHYPHNYW